MSARYTKVLRPVRADPEVWDELRELAMRLGGEWSVSALVRRGMVLARDEARRALREVPTPKIPH
jgi:hypothetical protein